MDTIDRAKLLEAAYDARDRQQAEEDSHRLAQSFDAFAQAAFPIIKPNRQYDHNWHHHAIAVHLEAVTAGEIDRFQTWVPPGTMKSLSVSVLWPVWEWIADRDMFPLAGPGLRYWCASHSLDLVWDHCELSGSLLTSRWFQQRWGHLFNMSSVAKTSYKNDAGGTRNTTTPKSGGVGKHGDRIILDDLLDAGDAESTTRAVLDTTNDWYDAVISGRKETGAAEILIMQRLHENDPAAHALEVGDWTVLCLPERYEKDHPFAWRKDRVHPFVKTRLEGTLIAKGDPRVEGELLWPWHRGDRESDEYAKRLRSFRAAGQLQQRPAAREGDLLKRAWWRFYDPRIREFEQWDRLPKFGMTVVSVDTPLKDKESSDNVAIQCYGVRGADRYLLDLRLGKMNYSGAKRQIKEMSLWARKTWPRMPHYVLIENAGYGVEMIIDLRRELTGVTKITPGKDGDKVIRAEAASDALESGNYFLPGIGPPDHPAFNEAVSPDDIVKFVHNCALFPNVTHDDDIDCWSQFGNWMRGRTMIPMKVVSPAMQAAGR